MTTDKCLPRGRLARRHRPNNWLNSYVHSRYLTFQLKNITDIFRHISKKCHKFKKLQFILGTLITKHFFYDDFTKIIKVKYFQNYLYFCICVNLKLKFACIKLSLHFFSRHPLVCKTAYMKYSVTFRYGKHQGTVFLQTKQCT